MRNIFRDKAIKDIHDERERQIVDKGRSLEHDDEHTKGELAMHAAYYASPATARNWYRHIDMVRGPNARQAPLWPWDEGWIPDIRKFTNRDDDENTKEWVEKRRVELVKAAALIVAEIERLDRIEDHANTP